MDNASGAKPAPFGAPRTTATPGEAGGYFETGRPRLGGLQDPIRFDDTQAAVINAAADTIIPPHPDRPTASEHDLVTFVRRYVTPPDDSVLNKWCQTWDLPNLFIVDGSTLTTGGAVNPTSTIGALACRTGEYISRNFHAITSQKTTPSNADAPTM